MNGRVTVVWKYFFIFIFDKQNGPYLLFHELPEGGNMATEMADSRVLDTSQKYTSLDVPVP